MIGSLMSRMADAEKLSIPQLNQAVKNGTIPAYVGVPLIQEKMKAEQAAKAMVAQTQAQPPIARQVMEQADMMSGLEKLQSNLPEEGYAGGGIVAFAEGGETPEPSAPAQPTMSIAPPKGYTFDQASGQYDPINQSGDILALLRGEVGPIAKIRELIQDGRGYADGGVTTPDDDEDEEKNLMSRLMAGITSLKQGVSDRIPSSDDIKRSIVNKMPSGMRNAIYDGPRVGDYVAPPTERRARGGHKYEGMVAAEAERIGLDPTIAIHALYKETGNLKNPESARSRAGALGVMQLMPKTAKELGVDPLNPEENIRGGVMYLKKMYDKYQDPTLALAAYNAGPGRVDKALKSGQGIAALPRETQNYVMASRMAGGGIVAFQNRGLVNQGEIDALGGQLDESRTILEGLQSFGSRQRSQIPDFDARLTEAKKRRDDLQSQYEKLMSQTGVSKAAFGVPPMGLSSKPREADPTVQQLLTSPGTATVDQPPVTGTPMSQMEAQDRQEGLGATPAFDRLMAAQQKGEGAAPEPYREPAADQGLSDIKSLLKQRMEESGKQKRIDAYMSLLQAGLGMMGGTSPFAAANIGQGAAQGVAAQMAARKSQVADENAILTGQLGLSRAELYEKMRRDALRQQAEKTAAELGLRKSEQGIRQQSNLVRLGDLRRKAIEDWENSPRKMEIEARLAKQRKNWRDDKKLSGEFELARSRFIDDIMNVGRPDNTPLATSLLGPQ